MPQACNILSRQGAASNNAGGRTQAKTVWGPVAAPAWSSSTTYDAGEVAQGADSKVYHSTKVNNLDNEPSASPGLWTPGWPCVAWRDRIFSTPDEQAGIAQGESRFKIAVPIGTPVDATKRIQIIGGPVYEIIGSDEIQGNAVQLVFDCKKVQ